MPQDILLLENLISFLRLVSHASILFENFPEIELFIFRVSGFFFPPFYYIVWRIQLVGN